MTKVVVQNGNVDLALKKFKAKFARSGVPSELKKRKCYEKPGVKMKRKKTLKIHAVETITKEAIYGKSNW